MFTEDTTTLQQRLAHAEEAIARAEARAKEYEEFTQEAQEAATHLQEEKDLAPARLKEKADFTNQKTPISKL